MEYTRLLLGECDPDELLGVIDGSSMRHQVLRGGRVTADVERFTMPLGTATRGRYGMRVHVRGAWPDGLVTIGCVIEAAGHVGVNGFECPPLSLQLYGEHCELDYIAPPGAAWFVYSARRDTLQQAALSLCGRELPIPRHGVVSVRPEPMRGLRVVAAIQALLAHGADGAHAWRASPRSPAPTTREEAHLVLELTQALERRPRQHEIRAASQRRHLLVRSEDYLRAALDEPFDLVGLAAATGATPRMLQYQFKSLFGLSPRAWHASMRLNAVRADLRRASVHGESVSDVALRWGLTHFGRFARDYRRMFGELPVETLRCARKSVARRGAITPA